MQENNVIFTCDALTLAALLLPKAFSDDKTGVMDHAIRDKVEALRAILLAEAMHKDKLVNTFVKRAYEDNVLA